MADCEVLSKCPFFNDQMQDMPGIATIYKEKYCKTDNSECAPYIVLKALGTEKIPANLFPNMLEKAKKIIAENK